MKKTEIIQDIWKYGIIWIGQYINEKTINYIMKYITKVDEDHKGFKAVILTSAGIGKQYTENKHKTSKNKYQEGKTDETYRLPNGAIIVTGKQIGRAHV